MRSSHRRVFLVVFVLLCAPVLFAENAEQEYNGKFTLVFDTPKAAAFKPIAKEVRESHLFDSTVEQLNDTIALPEDLQIAFTECGEVNAFYDSKNKRLLMCYELIGFFQKQFAAAYEDKDEAEKAVWDSTIFVFHHELGHALVDVLDLPVTGKEEDAVDDLATLVLLHDWEGGDESALSAANAFYMMGEREEEAGNADDAIEKLPYYGEHSLGKQRYYEIACIVYGSDPEAHADLVGEGLPKERAVRCPSEYAQKSRSWGKLLADNYWAADEEQVEETTQGLMGSFGDEETQYQVVINHEEQYSIWPAERDLPAGWEAAGKTGTKQECLQYIREKMGE